MYHYRFTGLCIDSTILLPELDAWEGETVSPDLEIHHRSVAPLKTGVPYSGGIARFHERDVGYEWEGVGRFRITHGTSIWADPDPAADPRLVRLPIYSVALASALIQRGDLILHASSIDIAGGAVLFVGRHRQGKSTLAAYCHEAGFPVLGDDLACIRFSGSGEPLLFPGLSRIKLWPDALTDLGKSPDAFEPLHDCVDKRYLPIEPPRPTPRPVKAICFLGGGDTLGLNTITPGEALPILLGTTTLPQLLAIPALGQQFFRQSASLLNTVPAFSLKRPYDATILPQTVELIRDHFASADIPSH